MSTTNNPQLPEYVCTRRAQAARIIKIGKPYADDPMMWRLALELPDGTRVIQCVHAGYMQRHRPEVGGYFARNEDGYARYLPAAVFEADYAAVPNLQPISAEQIKDRAFFEGPEWSEEEIAAIKKRIREAPYVLAESVPELLAGKPWATPLQRLLSERVYSMMDEMEQASNALGLVPRQAEIIQQAPPASEHLHAAPHYQDLLPHKAGK